ncbi:helix-turn-helix domain-containing protein [Amycolatopsis sp. cmx-8-4]|uniref:helix-turn-helix domain-containing protein n=1 Tax=Amycolatopsis sp. cmx-8-4 TaxID=2790947 RepID=UPI00397BDB87
MTTAEPPPRTFGDYVAEVRTERGLSAKKLAAQMGVSLSTITRIEAGTLALPGPVLLCTLGDALNFDYPTAVGLLEPYRRLWQRLTATSDATIPPVKE